MSDVWCLVSDVGHSGPSAFGSDHGLSSVNEASEREALSGIALAPYSPVGSWLCCLGCGTGVLIITEPGSPGLGADRLRWTPVDCFPQAPGSPKHPAKPPENIHTHLYISSLFTPEGLVPKDLWVIALM